MVGFVEFYSTFGLLVIMVAPVIVCFLAYSQRARATYYAAVVTVMIFVMNVFKLSYHDPRPFWVDPEITGYECSTQYGNPSGHSLNSMGIAFTIWLDYNHYATSIPTSMSSAAWRYTMLAVAILFGVSIGFSRVFLGMHSWD
jgi:membrane-associated phospholipid phosphatase